MFCEKLVILVKGKSVLSGNLKKIKKDFGKKNITIDADVDVDKLKAVKGVLKVSKLSSEYVVSIESEDYIKNVFDYVKKCSNVRKFNVEDASLNEIFVSIVGGNYEEQA